MDDNTQPEKPAKAKTAKASKGHIKLTSHPSQRAAASPLRCNHPRAKNLIGAFHQPIGVVIDTDETKALEQLQPFLQAPLLQR